MGADDAAGTVLESNAMAKTLKIIGIILFLIGALWAFQGLGLVGGSFMTGERQWLIIGIITAVVGIVMVLWANLRRA